jgi:hypothetical protein
MLVLFHDPYHLNKGDALAWLQKELEAVLRLDELEAARLTRLGAAGAQPRGGFDWLLEFNIDRAAGHPRSAIRDLVADLRLLGMAPMVALADERDAIDLKRG